VQPAPHITANDSRFTTDSLLASMRQLAMTSPIHSQEGRYLLPHFLFLNNQRISFAGKGCSGHESAFAGRVLSRAFANERLSVPNGLPPPIAAPLYKAPKALKWWEIEGKISISNDKKVSLQKHELRQPLANSFSDFRFIRSFFLLIIHADDLVGSGTLISGWRERSAFARLSFRSTRHSKV